MEEANVLLADMAAAMVVVDDVSPAVESGMDELLKINFEVADVQADGALSQAVVLERVSLIALVLGVLIAVVLGLLVSRSVTLPIYCAAAMSLGSPGARATSRSRPGHAEQLTKSARWRSTSITSLKSFRASWARWLRTRTPWPLPPPNCRR